MRVLLTSVFKPFAQDDEFGSRAINPMELYHNQVTREQGPFSLRMFHRSWGLMFIQHNIAAPSTLLDFPTRERFVRELTSEHYDVVGISGIVVNLGKVREMCRLVREHSPSSTIVVGGHVTAIPGIETMIDADHIVRGEGIRWMREFLGEDPAAPIKHPVIPSSIGFSVLGLPGMMLARPTSATIIPSVGCPMGCNFCTTSAFFGGKGRFVNFYERGKDIFDAMCAAEQALGVSTFFVMDENFLLYKKRALELLDLMKAHGKAWSLYVFSSANAIRQYDVRTLVDLGVEWIWMGFESAASGYQKLASVDTQAMTAELQAHGICVLGSTIIGLEHHSAENIDIDIEHAAAHNAVFHQFMLYTPMPGTPLHEEVARQGRMLADVDIADIHGQFKFNFAHAAISRDESELMLRRAFQRDFDRNGPSLFRLMNVLLQRWRRYGADGDARVRTRVARARSAFRGGYAGALWAMEKYCAEAGNEAAGRMARVRAEVDREFGLVSKGVSRAMGPLLLWSARRDARRHPRGRRIEPPTFVDRRVPA